MTFHTQKNHIPIKQPWIEKFTSQPHQLFFTSSVLFAIMVMVLTILSLNGTITSEFTTIHSFGLIYAVFTNAFIGFLITVIPKYTHSKIIDKKHYLLPWIILQISMITTLIGFETIGKITLSLTLFYINFIFYQTIKKGTSIAKKESIVLNFLLFIGAVLLLCEILFVQNLSQLIFFAYLLALVFTVAQKMIPAFYSGQMSMPLWKKPKYLLEVAILLLFSLGIAVQFEMILFFKLSAFLSMIYFGYIVLNLNIYKKTPPILAILVLSFIWLEIGFVFLFIESIFEVYSLKLSLHIFAIGFVTNLLIGFGSRVVMGHAVPAQKIFADKITIFLFLLTQILVLSRVLASLFFVLESDIFMNILYFSSFIWIVLFIIWTLRYGKILLRFN
ncbi:MAG: NnrS family protein [Arcobacteraceae bacterium]|nr:NnrS family protein [Arcobacteraceae bacterium]